MRGFARFLLRRTVYALIVVAGIVFVVSAMTRLVPGDPVDIMAAGNPGLTEADKERLRADLGLNTPLLARYVTYLGHALGGDLGNSIRQQAPASQLILERLPATVELAFWALLLALIVAIPLGIVTALRRDTAIDYAGTVVAVLGVSTPGFLLGILMILAFAVELRWLPSSGYRGSALAALGKAIGQGDPGLFWRSFQYFLLPGVTLAFVPLAINARLTRSAMIEAMRQDFIRTARAKGVREIGVILRHGLHNALIPIVTLVGVQLGTLMSGAIVIETVFAWPGIGRLVVQAIDWRDYPLIQASVLCFAVLFVLLNMIIDVIYGLVDPRIGHE